MIACFLAMIYIISFRRPSVKFIPFMAIGSNCTLLVMYWLIHRGA
jgi:prepilin signal peptidase PulO-like enzyme (type II secretory pathway)